MYFGHIHPNKLSSAPTGILTHAHPKLEQVLHLLGTFLYTRYIYWALIVY